MTGGFVDGVPREGVAQPDLTAALRLARRRVAIVTAAEGGVDLEERIEELVDLLRALDKTGDRSVLVRVAERLTGIVADIDQDADAAGGHLREIAQVLVGVGLVEQAESVVAAFRHQRDRDEANALLVRIFAAKGDFRAAEQAVDAVTEADLRSDALIEVVRPLDEAGDHAGALRSARRAEEAIAAITFPEDQPRKLNHLVQVLLDGGHQAEAEQIAARIEEVTATLTDAHDRDWGYSSAVHALALTGQLDRAERLIPAIADRSPRGSALFRLSCSVAEAGDIDRGLRLASEITTVDTRSAVQGQLVLVVAEAGDVERAESIAAAIESPTSGSGALSQLAAVMATAGDQAGARRVAQEAERVGATISHPASRSLARQHRVDTLIDAGDFEQAELTALTPVEGYDSAWDLSLVARAMAEAGDLVGARRVLARVEPIVRGVTDPESRSWALSSLADDLLLTGDRDAARRTVVEATGSGPWYRSLLTVVALEPDAVRAVAEDLLAESS